MTYEAMKELIGISELYRIGIDCGCAWGTDGRLGCLRLDDMQEFYSEESV